MADDFRTGVTWAALRHELSLHRGESESGDFVLDVLDALMDASENHVPREYRRHLVDAALDAWVASGETWSNDPK